MRLGMMCWRGKKQVVLVLTSVCSGTSFGCLCIGVATSYWLYAFERVAHENGTIYLKTTTTGLWRKCVENDPKRPHKYCDYISYFTPMDREGLGSTESILLSFRRFVLFPLVSLSILLSGEVICLMAYCRLKRSVSILVSGILFVVGGLFILVGIVIYIGGITEEVGNKPRPSIDELPKFTYQYGSSFFLTVVSFVSSELTGVLSVYLYISQYQLAYHKEQERLSIVELTDVQQLRRSPCDVTAARSRANSHSFPLRSSASAYAYSAVSANGRDGPDIRPPVANPATVQRSHDRSHDQSRVVGNSHFALSNYVTARERTASMHELRLHGRTTPV